MPEQIWLLACQHWFFGPACSGRCGWLLSRRTRRRSRWRTSTSNRRTLQHCCCCEDPAESCGVSITPALAQRAGPMLRGLAMRQLGAKPRRLTAQPSSTCNDVASGKFVSMSPGSQVSGRSIFVFCRSLARNTCSTQGCWPCCSACTCQPGAEFTAPGHRPQGDGLTASRGEAVPQHARARMRRECPTK